MIACDWHHPGVDPYTGTKAAAIAHYQQIPAADRASLLAKMERNRPDQVVDIKRNTISGGFEPALTGMHFGRDKVCDTVDRSGWSMFDVQPALVYCSGDYCLIEPVICHNVSIVRRSPVVAQPPVAAIPAVEPEQPTAISTDSFEAAVVPPAPVETAIGYDPGFGYPVYGGGGFGGGPHFGPVPPFVYSLGTVSPVPEPSTWLSLAFGLIGIGFLRWRRS